MLKLSDNRAGRYCEGVGLCLFEGGYDCEETECKG